MMKIKTLSLLVLLSIACLSNAQIDTTQSNKEWPYSMPIFGKQATARGYQIQLPYGLNVNYVYNRMDLEITQFGMTIGDDLNSPINQLISEYVNLETLNFTNTIAKSSGMNLRADVWVFPFWNVYGIYANNTGTTNVSLQPTWYDDNGDLVLMLPEIKSTVDFSANSYGIGSTLVTKLYKSYFFSIDANMTWSHSELLTDPARLAVVSARIGDRVHLGKKAMLALYVGAMYRGFIDHKGNLGSIGIAEALPNLGSELFPAIDNKIDQNNQKIAELDPGNPLEQKQIEFLEAQNQKLTDIGLAVESLIESDVNYGIKKDIINNWSVQFGFNLELNQSLTLRGEFGKGTGNDFVLMGIQYRFGI
ncbi:hypothetical protein [Carboxylicivirga sp. M1479]|uniref:hypothetical protein n=1 Tax=Carboxylicivirga sp. M1479 TaxID=2594476 RepID=UPI001177BA8C|nr:hypothetical protein [Carboxylicivirga sp. M1479]TRX66316.1 hypothetical protein FNN09_14000 [Carboxylicivirga sp. M1479]